MEEILASIRQIISEDGEIPPAPAAASKKAAALDPEPMPRELSLRPTAAPEQANKKGESVSSRPAFETETRQAKEQPAERRAPTAAEPGHLYNGPTGRTDVSTYSPRPEPAGAIPSERKLLSDGTNTAVSGAFSALAHTILAQNARTLEDLVAEMLRPMLKEWLDDNLPSVVERLVQEEIQRVARGRR
jgi:cell pole-organizing protein PopZ